MSQAQEKNFRLMPIIIYTDGASPDFRRSLSIKPIVVSVGNYVGEISRKVSGKRCIGYWPKIKVFLPYLCLIYVYFMSIFA